MSTNADFQDIKIYPRFPDRVVIQWAVINAFQSGTYTFSIYRSENSSDDFTCITPVPLVNKYRFVDLLVPNTTYAGQNSLFTKNYYQIVMTMPDGTEVASVIVSTGAFTQRDVFLKVQEIQRKYKLLSERYIGVPTYLLKIRKYGENCPKCWDSVKHESRDSHCLTCYGVGKTGGYFAPELMTGHFEVSPQTEQITSERGGVDQQESNFRAIADPLIDPYDVLVEKDSNDRWIVYKQVQQTEHKRVSVSQIVTVREIPRSSVLYAFPIPEQDTFEPQVPDADALLSTHRDPGALE